MYIQVQLVKYVSCWFPTIVFWLIWRPTQVLTSNKDTQEHYTFDFIHNFYSFWGHEASPPCLDGCLHCSLDPYLVLHFNFKTEINQLDGFRYNHIVEIMTTESIKSMR